MKTIQVKIKQVYGNEAIYPACIHSQVFADMVGQKTLTRRNLDYIKKLGYNIVVVNDAVTL